MTKAKHPHDFGGSPCTESILLAYIQVSFDFLNVATRKFEATDGTHSAYLLACAHPDQSLVNSWRTR